MHVYTHRTEYLWGEQDGAGGGGGGSILYFCVTSYKHDQKHVIVKPQERNGKKNK